MEKKKFWLSKTVWMQVLALIVVIVPASQHVIAPYFSELGAGWAIVNLILRALTKQELTK